MSAFDDERDVAQESDSSDSQRDLSRSQLFKLAGLAGAAAAFAPLSGLSGIETASAAGVPAAAKGKWASGVHIRFFTGGAAGDAFGSIVQHGAQQAAKDLGCSIDYLYSSWDPSTMVQQLRESIAAKPDGIAMMGHPGDAALMPLAKQAKAKGVLMEYMNVNVPKVIAKYGGGYVGAILFSEGQRLGQAAVSRFHLKKGQTAIVFGNFGIPGIAPRDLGIVSALHKHGLKVIKIVQQDQFGSNPAGMSPLVVGAIHKYPQVKLISFSGGQFLGASGIYFKQAGKKPGQIKAIGFDMLPSVVSAMHQGWAQLTWVQQPFIQGYLPVLSLCLTKKWLFTPLSFDTGSGEITASSLKKYIPLINAGIVG